MESIDQYLVACSGGADSVLAAHLIVKQVEKSSQVTLIYFNHQLRTDDQIKKEITCVKALAKQLNCIVCVINLDVQDFAKKYKVSIELAGRLLRQQALYKKAKKERRIIVTGHHEDDLYETFLFRLIKGVKSAVVPMKKQDKLVDIPLIRPLLESDKDEIKIELKRLNQDYIVDKSNEDEIFDRNKIRQSIIPLINQINPKAKKQAQSFWTYVNNVQDAYFKQIKEKVNTYQWDRQILVVPLKDGIYENELIQKQWIYECLKRIQEKIQNDFIQSKSTYQSYVIEQKHVNLLCEQINKGKKGQCLTLSGEWVAHLDQNYLNIFKQISHPKFEYVLKKTDSNELKINEIKKVIRIDYLSGRDSKHIKKKIIEGGMVHDEVELKEAGGHLSELYLDADKIKGKEIKIRSMIQNDKFKPLGTKVKRNLKTYVNKQKLSLIKKTNLTLFFVENDLACILNHQLSEDYKITSKTKLIAKINCKAYQ